MEDCLFCMIAEGKIPSKKLYEDDQVVAFYDINPQAKVHFLVVPKKHIVSAAALTEEALSASVSSPVRSVLQAPATSAANPNSHILYFFMLFVFQVISRSSQRPSAASSVPNRHCRNGR